MAISFVSPGYRAASSDLTIQISPLGLVELADEEFEVHGPRLNRYAQEWAFYLGKHWSYRRQIGEPQLTFNWCGTFADFLTNFCLTNGVVFSSPKVTQAIVPELLRTVWEEHQPFGKDATLWELLITGGVSGDCFIKVALEQGWADPAGNVHPPRIRILPLNSAFVFPEWHPHDMTRLLRVKLKYRFWATALEGTRQVMAYTELWTEDAMQCVDERTEALTKRGWMRHSELRSDDFLMTFNPKTYERQWQPLQALAEYEYDSSHDGPLVSWCSEQMDAVTTSNHRWFGNRRTLNRKTGETWGPDEFLETQQWKKSFRVRIGGGDYEFPDESKYTDDFVELIGWVITEGHYQKNYSKKSPNAQINGVIINQSARANSDKLARIWRLVNRVAPPESTFSRYPADKNGGTHIYLGAGLASLVREAAPDRQLTPEFLLSLTKAQALLLYETLMAGDGSRGHSDQWIQQDQRRIDGFEMLCSLLGWNTSQALRINEDDNGWSCVIGVGKHKKLWFKAKPDYVKEVDYKGVVWCPQVKNSIWLARRNGYTYWTGNSFINDELIESQENPLGVIPFVHISNKKVAGSPWGLSDITDIVDLNRQYNETATLISDIVNYYASPITVISGAKMDNLERGPNKVWAVPSKDARIENLEISNTLDGPLAFLELIKQKMHEIVGIPVNALGQELAISNTSGVALSLQFLPLMQKFRQKIIQYSAGFVQLNELIIRVAALYMPEMLQFDPMRDAPLQEGQVSALDPKDPLTYRNTVEFMSPLPLDKLLLLNEITSEMQLGLQSKVGALRKLGEPYPEEKLEELLNELHQDMLEQGALDLLKAELAVVIGMKTGIMPEGMEGSDQSAPAPQSGVQSAGGPGVNSAPQATQPSLGDPEIANLFNQLNTLAAGTKIPQVRNPLKRADDD